MRLWRRRRRLLRRRLARAWGRRVAHSFAVSFKYLFRQSRGVLSRLLFGNVVEWPNIEQPAVRNLRADLLARSADGVLRQVELQVSNDAGMAFRMLEYYAGFYRLLGEHVEQTALYAGREHCGWMMFSRR
jgi:hypothetical protein